MSGKGLLPAAILFDLDGTLADSFAAIHEALEAASAQVGLPGHDLAWVRRHVGRGAVALVRDAVGEDAPADLLAEVGRLFDARYREIYLEHTPPVAGAREVVRVVAARTGGRVAVVSNKFSSFSRGWLERWEFAPSVALVVGPDTYGVAKPDPAVVAPILRLLGVGAAAALMVGDMAVDAATARAAGVPAVLVAAPGGAERDELEASGPVAVLESIRGLPVWLAANGEGWRGVGPLPG